MMWLCHQEIAVELERLFTELLVLRGTRVFALCWSSLLGPFPVNTMSASGLSQWTVTCHLPSQTFAYKLVAKGSYEGAGKSLSLWPLRSIQEKRKTSPVKSQVHSWDIGAKRTQTAKSGSGSRHHHPILTASS